VSAWDDTTARDAMLSPSSGDRARAETCATCERLAPPGTLRCDACVNAEFNTLRATHGEAWHDAHKQWRRGEAGHAEP